MRYTSEHHEAVINTHGECKAIEALGFQPESKAVNSAKPKAIKSADPGMVLPPSPTRNQLMEKVKSLGIKNFRVMNKEELKMIVSGASVPQIEAIQLAAVTRWKSGWKAKG